MEKSDGDRGSVPPGRTEPSVSSWPLSFASAALMPASARSYALAREPLWPAAVELLVA